VEPAQMDAGGSSSAASNLDKTPPTNRIDSL
jgi:hypothetical protein